MVRARGSTSARASVGSVTSRRKFLRSSFQRHRSGSVPSLSVAWSEAACFRSLSQGRSKDHPEAAGFKCFAARRVPGLVPSCPASASFSCCEAAFRASCCSTRLSSCAWAVSVHIPISL